MDISQVMNSQAAGQAADARQERTTMGKDGFLQLLVAQMKNQDPINPLKGTEFATQLAQFNSVEQLLNLNDGMQAMVNSQQLMAGSITNVMTVSLVGKEVRALGDQVQLEAGGTADISWRMAGAADSVEIRILDQSGSLIRSETLSGLPSGDQAWEWDGKDNSGNTAAEGIYRVEVNAMREGSPVKTLTLVEGEVESLRYGSGTIELVVNGVPVDLGDVEEVGIL